MLVESSLCKLNVWREDLQEDLPSKNWEEVCVESTACLLQYKWLMRTYVTPEKLNKYNGILSQTCVSGVESKSGPSSTLSGNAIKLNPSGGRLSFRD